MLRLVYLYLRGRFRLHIIWVSWMIQILLGIYGFPRGCLKDGIASYLSNSYFGPLKETSFDCLATLLPWVQIWIGVNKVDPLTPEGWSQEVHVINEGNNNYIGIWVPYNSKGTFLCAPVPSMVDFVFRQFVEDVHKCPSSLYIFICTKLNMSMLGRLLLKMHDLVVYVQLGAKNWQPSMHNMFILGFVSLLIPQNPWRIRGTPKIL